ncbi:MAG TPA: hypothetical protein VFG43_07980 [Geminicoccaceae bacterium]|nr:hypothetical protein [Geminicoccaceae bacterium]
MLQLELDRGGDRRWIVAIPALTGVVAYGASREETVAWVKAPALGGLAERMEGGEPVPELAGLFAAG